MEQAAQPEWVAYCKPPFAGPEQVLRHLDRGTRRTDISNERIVSIQNGLGKFRFGNRADGDLSKFMTMDAVPFLRRFLLYVLPRRLV